MSDEESKVSSKSKHASGAFAIKPPPNPLPANDLDGLGPIHPDLPIPPFFIGVIGPRKRGKTVFLYSLLNPQEAGSYGSAFKKSNIVLFSPLGGQDKTLKLLDLKNMYGPPMTVAALVQSICKDQTAHKEDDNMTGVLLVFDDITSCKEAWPSIEYLSYYSRHLHIHVMYVAHKMSSIPRGVRTQTQQWVLFKPHEESEIQWIMDMFARKRTRDIWEAALYRVWKEKFAFVYIDFEGDTMELIYRKGFHEPLFTPEEMQFIDGVGDIKYYNPSVLPTNKADRELNRHSKVA